MSIWRCKGKAGRHFLHCFHYHSDVERYVGRCLEPIVVTILRCCNCGKESVLREG